MDAVVSNRATFEVDAVNSNVDMTDCRQAAIVVWLKAGEGIREMKYAVIVEAGERSFGAHGLGLPSCVAVVDTKKYCSI